MEKIKKLLTSVDFILVMFLLIGLRSVFVGSGIGDALALASVASLIGAIKYIDMQKGPDINEDLRKQLDEMRAHVTAMALKQGIKEVPNVREMPKDMKRWF